MKRSFLRAVASGLVGVLVVAQISIAAYACPAMLSPEATNTHMPAASASASEPSSAKAGARMAQMSHCDDMAGTMDSSSANLCAEHCKYGQQSDHAPTVDAPAAVVMFALYVIPDVPEMAPPPRPAADPMNALVAASPPHAILHCVYRI